MLHNEPMEYLHSYLQDTGFVPSVVLLVVFYALLRGVRDSMWRIAVLSLPGTIAHELTHFIVGALLLAKPRRFSVWPKAVGRSWRLGSVWGSQRKCSSRQYAGLRCTFPALDESDDFWKNPAPL